MPPLEPPPVFALSLAVVPPSPPEPFALPLEPPLVLVESSELESSELPPVPAVGPPPLPELPPSESLDPPDPLMVPPRGLGPSVVVVLEDCEPSPAAASLAVELASSLAPAEPPLPSDPLLVSVVLSKPSLLAVLFARFAP